MAALIKFNRFVTDLALGVHNLDTGAVKMFLSNQAPLATNTVKADIAEIATGFGYTGPIDISAVVTQNAGVMELSFTDQVVTRSGGAVGPFRYVYIYNDTPTSPADPLICAYDYSSAITLNVDGETFTTDFAAIALTIQ